MDATDQPSALFRRLLGQLRPDAFRLSLIGVALVVNSAAALAAPWLAKNLFRDAVIAREAEKIPWALLAILAVAGVMALARFLAEDQLGRVSLGLLRRLREEMVGKLTRLPAEQFIKGRAGDAVSRVFGDVHMLGAFAYDAVFSLGADVLTVGGCVAMMFALDWRLASLAFLVVPIAAGLVGLTSRWTRRRLSQVQSALEDMTSRLAEKLHAMPAIQALEAGDWERRAFAHEALDHYRHGTAAHRAHAGVRAMINFLGAAAFVGVLAFGARYVWFGEGAAAEGRLTLDGLVGFGLYAALLAEPLTRLSRTHFEIQRALVSAKRVFELLDQPDDHRAGTQPLATPVRGRLEFHQVSFAYRPDEPVLKAIDLRVEAGEAVAIVGGSGAGKSTLAGLLLRFFDPTSGRVLLDGLDLRDVRRAELRQQVGWASQDPFLFRGTVADNIRYGRWEASEREVERAALLAGLADFLHDAPRGLATRIGERGTDLSGGQRARLSLARVILRDPRLVILDETTASLDTDTEQRLWRDLNPWLHGRTALVIAHRLTTILHRDRVVVLDEGRVAGDGPVDELRRSCPAFVRLFGDQWSRPFQAA